MSDYIFLNNVISLDIGYIFKQYGIYHRRCDLINCNLKALIKVQKKLLKEIYKVGGVPISIKITGDAIYD